jgi:probable HAF family extracellular repeat protein
MNKTCLAALLLTHLPWTNTFALPAPRYTLVDLHTAGAARSVAYSINGLGQVVGGYGPYTAVFKGAYYNNQPFIYKDGTKTLVDRIGSSASWAWGIGDGGHLAGAIWPDEKRIHAALFAPEGIVDLGTFGGNMSLAFDVNAHGDVVGWAENGLIENQAFLYSNSQMINLGTLGGDSSEARAINDRGQVVGYSEYSKTSNSNHAFLYSDNKMIDLGTLGGAGSEAYDINEKGQIVGLAAPPFIGFYRHRAFLYENGHMIDLGTLGGDSSYARAINEKGQIVGDAYLPNGSYHAFIYDRGGMTDLNSLIEPNSGWELLSAADINDIGQIVGMARVDGQSRAFLLNPIPEPISMVGITTVFVIVAGSRSLTQTSAMHTSSFHSAGPSPFRSPNVRP